MSYSIGSMALRSVFRVSPMFALVWEQWRITRGPIGFAILFALATILPLGFVSRNEMIGDYADLSVITSLAFCITYATAFTLSRKRPGEELCLGFPQPENCLPVRRSALVWTVLLYRLGVVGTLALALGGLANMSLHKEFVPTYSVTAITVCGLAFMTAVSWTLGKRNTAVALVAMFGLAIPIVVTCATMTEEYHVRPIHQAMVLAVVFGGVAAWGATREHRTWISAETLATFAASILLPSKVARFGSPAEAQFWYEWRKRGIVLPLCTVCMVIAPPVLVGVMNTIIETIDSGSAGFEKGLNFTAVSICNWFPGALLFVSGLTGAIFLCLDEYAYRAKRSGRMETRPMSSSLLAEARLKMSLYSAGIGYGMAAVALACAAIYLRFWGHQSFDWEGILTEKFAMVVTLAALASFLMVAWSLIWSPLVLLSALTWTVWVLMPISVLCEMLGYGRYVQKGEAFAVAAYGMPLVCSILLAVYFGIRCRRRNLLPKSTATTVTVLSIAAAILVVVSPPLVAWGSGNPLPSFQDALHYYLIATWVAVLPALAVFSQGVWVARLRYNR